MDAERAQLECGENEFEYLVKYKIIKQETESICIDFLDDNMDEIIATSKKNSDNAKMRWQKRKERKQANAMPNDAVAMRSHKVAMPNDADKIRKEQKRGDEKRKQQEAFFLDFWNAYGKKVEKEKCLKKWMSLTYDEYQLALDKVDLYVASTPDVQFRKNPLTWLNGKCWNDEIILPSQKQLPTKFEQAAKADLQSMIRYE